MISTYIIIVKEKKNENILNLQNVSTNLQTHVHVISLPPHHLYLDPIVLDIHHTSYNLIIVSLLR